MLRLLILSLSVAVIALTLTRAQIFRPLRYWLDDHNEWLADLFYCPYCMSHWASLIVVSLSGVRLIKTSHWIMDLILTVLSVTGTATFLAGIIWKVLQFAPIPKTETKEGL